jgi:hypothetical protein
LQFSIPGFENLSQAAKYVIAFAIIFVLLALFALILRRLTGGRMSLASERGRARQPRLGIVDVYDLDRQRQLILLRRDNVEHLLLVGGPNDVVVETNIVRSAGARLPTGGATVETLDRAEPALERTVEIAPVRPVVEAPPLRVGDRPPEPVAAHLGNAEAPIGARPAGRAIVEPALRPSTVSATSGMRPTERARRGAEPLEPRPNGSRQSTEGPPAPAPVAPPPVATTPVAAGDEVVLSDMTRQLGEALKRPAPPAPEFRPQPRTPEPPRPVPGGRPEGMAARGDASPRPEPRPRSTNLAPPEPPPAEPRPGPETSRSEAAPGPEPVHPPEAAPREQPVPLPPAPPAPPSPEAAPPPEAAVAAEMRAPEPPPATAEPPRPSTPPPRPAPPRPLARPPQPPPRAAAEDRPAVVAPASAPVPDAAPVPAPEAAPPAPPPQAAPAPSQAEETPPEPEAAPPPPSPPPSRSDPFSIEDIEAEFARLLGRPIDRRDDRGR